MSLLPFRKRQVSTAPLGDILEGHSIEVMPRTASKIEDFRAILPQGTRVYIAHIDGTPIEDMVATAARIRAEGFSPMPHFPARIIADRATLENWLTRYRDEADVNEGLILAGGVKTPVGEFSDSMQLLSTGLFDQFGFKRLHVAGHPEGNSDIDPNGSDKNVMEAARWKQEFSKRTDAKMAMATQFCFEAEPVLAWGRALRDAGIDLPIHLGVAGPAKLQTMIKFAMACGVGPSLRVLQKRAMDVSKLLLPYEPTEFLSDLARARAEDENFPIAQLHFFPLGGITATTDWTRQNGANNA